MIRRLLLRVGDACSCALPPDWRDAARAEARTIDGTGALARWTLGLVRLRLRPGLALGRRRQQLRRR
jgi:hypothetical protein